MVVTSAIFFPMRVSERFSMSQIPTCFATCKEVSKASPKSYKNCMKNCIKNCVKNSDGDCRSDHNNSTIPRKTYISILLYLTILTYITVC